MVNPKKKKKKKKKQKTGPRKAGASQGRQTCIAEQDKETETPLELALMILNFSPIIYILDLWDSKR